MLAAHEGFTGFIMTGEAPEFVASALAPHGFDAGGSPRAGRSSQQLRRRMAAEMSYWAGWPHLHTGARPALRRRTIRTCRASRPSPPAAAGRRAHAVDALRHFSAETRVPRTLASLSRYETRKRGLNVADSSRRILETGLVVPATDLEAWLAGWTRRDLLGFLAQGGLRPRNSGARSVWRKWRGRSAKSWCARDVGVGGGASWPRSRRRRAPAAANTWMPRARRGGCGWDSGPDWRCRRRGGGALRRLSSPSK